jgi:ABC-2 type transport system ATP-binding protein
MLVLRDFRRAFGSTVAVEGLSLEVREGEVFGLLGPNGAGKSTTIGIATGLLVPDAGSVDLLGLGSPASARGFLGRHEAAPQSRRRARA